MTKVFTDVSVFMKASGQNVLPLPENTVSAQAELYKELIREETKEFWDAEAVHDDVEEIDACFDMIWVIVGYMQSRGWDCEGIWDEGAKSNLSKIDPVTGAVRKRADGKIMKPDGWKKPDFSKFV
jgi:predicted HAD superfamily Cof-like phosphohydrolase